ncbi:hypothetical protein CW357_08740 [Rummeliibacillus sp. TYF005]|uniref:hypothetical protein n=1 Tax=Rummeliibacillus sp. TYF005 TaxID=2058214 RepID=UPI000F548A24|nr:hypothetical protein [Rummeliibacillus sp. TYF005]RPJ95755.1 hypothetical protein CW357_08740 [Rummeliibacillus sp. TYF005]
MNLLMSKSSIAKSFLLLSVLVLIFASFPSSSSAAGNIENHNLTQLEDELEFIFDKATTLENDKYILDENKIIEYFGNENLESIKIFIKLVNGESITETEFTQAGLTPIKTPSFNTGGEISTFSWTSCIKEKIMIATGIGFITGGMNKLIEEKAWKKLSLEIAKIVGKNAIKGGVVGLTASLAVWSIVCVGE